MIIRPTITTTQTTQIHSLANTLTQTLTLTHTHTHETFTLAGATERKTFECQAINNLKTSHILQQRREQQQQRRQRRQNQLLTSCTHQLTLFLALLLL